MNFDCNEVNIAGEIIDRFNYSHKKNGERFYKTIVRTRRFSKSCDKVPVIVSERIIDIESDLRGYFVKIRGQFRSFNQYSESEGRKKLILSVFAENIEFFGEEENLYSLNEIFLDGYVCKDPLRRKTPLGREIADVLLAVNRPYGTSDYIPCVAWERNAKYSEICGVGTRVKLRGRIQSREYIKKLEDGTAETRTAYEVSVSWMKAVEE